MLLDVSWYFLLCSLLGKLFFGLHISMLLFFRNIFFVNKLSFLSFNKEFEFENTRSFEVRKVKECLERVFTLINAIEVA